MKVLLIILSLCLLALHISCSEESFDEFKPLFDEFLQQYKKSYNSAEEYELRFTIFKENVGRIRKLRSIQTGTAVYGVDKFADMSGPEFRRRFLMAKRFDATSICKWPYSRYAQVDELAQGPAPVSWDWVTQGAVVGVKNQEECGSCWAFSTAANIEGQWFLAKHNLTSFSEQVIVDCSHGCLKSNPGLCNSGCGGGLPWLAYEDIISWSSGLTTEASYPYVGTDQTCMNITSAQAGHISNWTAVGPQVSTINLYLVNNGPLSITLNADLLFGYTSGIINADPSQCDPIGSDHAVTLVGFGRDPKTLVNYWIVKNSWGTDWGMGGYFFIASDKGLCGINACVTSALVK